MNILWITIFSLNGLLFLGLFFFSADFFYRDVIRKGAPFVPIPKKALVYLRDAIKLSNRSVVYDLGSGDARILTSLYHIFPEARFVGVEYSFLAYLLARFRTFWIPKERIRLIRKDFFRMPITEATHVFVYLLPSNLVRLMPKLAAELKKGTLVVSFDFPLPGRIPKRIIETPFSRGRYIRVYEF